MDTLTTEPLMAENDIHPRLVLTTAADRAEAERLARTLVEERLIACATLLPGATSIYRWQGAVEESAEVLLLLKTTAARLDTLEARLHQLHSYQTPEFLVFSAAGGSAAYLDWLAAAVQTA